MFTHKRERDRGREGGEREREREGEGKREERQHYDRLPTCTLNPFKDRKEGTSGQRQLPFMLFTISARSADWSPWQQDFINS